MSILIVDIENCDGRQTQCDVRQFSDVNTENDVTG